MTYTASDAAGNQADPLTRTITIEDQTAPQLVLLGDAIGIELSVGDAYVEAGVDVSDNVDESVNVSTTGTVDTTVPGNYTLTYTASDAAGNQATPLTRNHHRGGVRRRWADITVVGDLAIVLEIGTSYYPDEGAIALDDVDVLSTLSPVGPWMSTHWVCIP